jgi:transposase-like protein
VYVRKNRSKSNAKEGIKEYKCAEKACNVNFTVTVGTIFESTKLPLRVWFGAIWLTTTTSKGISSLNLSKQLGITQKSAWFVLSRIREMFASTEPDMLLTGTIEADETYIGGKEKNKSKKVRAANKAKAQELSGKKRNVYPIDTKTAILGILQKDGKIRVQPMVDNSRETLVPLLKNNISADATVVTDGLRAYHKLGDVFKHHVIVNHNNDEWVKDGFTTNDIESFWAIFKRGITGVYHQLSDKHLQRYCDEYSQRFNNRKDKNIDRFAEAVSKTANTRITYKRLIAD